MIHEVWANRPGFHPVQFTPGFNVVLADVTAGSAKKDSRNGLGKTTLVQIVHFCLGSKVDKNKGLRSPHLNGWRFSLDLEVGARRVTVSRSVDTPAYVEISGGVGDWVGRSQGNARLFRVEEWTTILGQEMFALSPQDTASPWSPTFRSLVSTFARCGETAFNNAFEHHAKQQEWDKQVNNAFLLGLAWQDAQAFQVLRAKAVTLNSLKKAASEGLVDGYLGTVGDLEALKVQMRDDVQTQRKGLDSFRVHQDYRQIEKDATTFTRKIHDLSNANVGDRRRLDFYNTAVSETTEAGSQQISDMYRAVGVELPGIAVKRLDEVQDFHRQLIANRKTFLADEMNAIVAAIAVREAEIRSLSDRRAELLETLRSHGALEEFTALQNLHADAVNRLKDVETRLASRKKFDAGKDALKLEKAQLAQKAKRDYEDRQPAWQAAISLFNAHSQALYEAPGRLVIDPTDDGFKFDVKIERASAGGFQKMKAFCYDLMLSEIWAAKQAGPRFLIHDSTIFEGVDSRQFARALQQADKVSKRSNFQYICLLNSDSVPRDEFDEGFDFDSAVRLRLTDERPEGSLLGTRF